MFCDEGGMYKPIMNRCIFGSEEGLVPYLTYLLSCVLLGRGGSFCFFILLEVGLDGFSLGSSFGSGSVGFGSSVSWDWVRLRSLLKTPDILGCVWRLGPRNTVLLLNSGQ